MTSRILAVANQKGGVGKTTTTLGLAAALAASGQRVLIVDMDPQANASSTLLPDYDTRLADDTLFTTNDILEQGVDPAHIVDAITPTPWAGVDLIASQQALAHRDVEGATGIEMRLRRVLKGLPTLTETSGYHHILLDCPPSVGRLTVNAFLAASRILLISGPDRYGHHALTQIEDTLATIADAYGHDIEVAGVIVNMFENTTEANNRTQELRDRYGDKFLMTMPKRTVLSLVAGRNESVFTFNRPDAIHVATGYFELARTLGLIEASAPVPALPVAKRDMAEPVAPMAAVAVGE